MSKTLEPSTAPLSAVASRLSPSGVPLELWRDWQWQQKNCVRSADDLRRVFPDLEEPVLRKIAANQTQRRFQITPYTLSLIERRPDCQAPVEDDPLWRQLAPTWTEEANAPFRYDAESENWELPHEMVTPIAQHKYDNRVLIRLSNVCQGYCQFCYEALRTLEKDSHKEAYQKQNWADTVAYVRQHPEVEEVILSGGEPLLRSDAQLAAAMADLRGIGRWIAIRIHTRSLTFNPFRVTDELLEILRRYEVSAIGLHVCHPNELSDEFKAAVRRLHTAAPVLFANIPLLGGVNDEVNTMRKLVLGLYREGVLAQYLYHFLPFSPGMTQFRTPVQTGIDIVRALKRRISNLAIPEFVIAHTSGKHTMPLLAEGEDPPRKGVDAQGSPVLRYTNWKGERVEYFDTPQSVQIR